MDRHHEKKTALLVDNLRRCGGAESILIFHKLTRKKELAVICSPSLSPSFSLPPSPSLSPSLSAVIHLGTLLIGMVFFFFPLISQKHLTLVFARPGVCKVPEKTRNLVVSLLFHFLMHRVRVFVCLCSPVAAAHCFSSADNHYLFRKPGT